MKIKDHSVLKTLLNLGKSSYVCLPASFLKLMGLKRQDRVIIKFRNGRLEITPLERRPKA